jgi:hypothetical protein
MVMVSRRMLGWLGVLAMVAVAGCTASPAPGPVATGQGRSAASAAAPVSPGAASGSASAGPGDIRNLPASRAVRDELTAAYAHNRGIPLSDVAGINPGSLHYAYDPATYTYWAEASFLPSNTAPSQVLVGFQDGVEIGLFTKIANGSWRVQIGGEPVVCTAVQFFPPAVLRAWSLPADTAGFACRPQPPGPRRPAR